VIVWVGCVIEVVGCVVGWLWGWVGGVGVLGVWVELVDGLDVLSACVGSCVVWPCA
jgi:hypothetical protein